MASWTAACTSSSQVITAPSAAKCGVTASAKPTSFGATGGSGTLTISTSRDCQWTASAAASWIQLAGTADGQGESTVQFKVAANPDPSTRKAAIGVADQQVGITQDAAPCTFSVNPGRDTVAAAGAQKSIEVKASSAQCSWTARSSTEWLTIVDGATGSGSGVVRYAALATTGPARSGTLDVAGQSVTIAQASGCRYALAPGSQSFAGTGGVGTVGVMTAAGCTWAATSDSPWLTITGGGSGSGAGTVTFSVMATEMGIPARTATVTIGDQKFAAAQVAGPPCVYTLPTALQTFPGSPGGVWSFFVGTGRLCSWTVSTSASWITIRGDRDRIGSSVVVFTIAVNPLGSPLRTGLITVSGGPSFSVVQYPAP